MLEKYHEEIVQLLCYMITCARGLFDEPVSYGPLRLIESVTRLIEIIEKQKLADNELLTIKELIDQNKFLIKTNQEKFKSVLDEIVIILVNQINKEK